MRDTQGSIRRGFILQPTYRLEGGRPVVHLYGKLETGKSFLVRDDRAVPYFYVNASDADRARGLGATKVLPSTKVTLAGEAVARVELTRPADTPPLRERLQAEGVPCFEADVLFAMRYLIDRGIRGSLAIHGSPAPGIGIGEVFDNPEVAPADWTPTLEVLSFDIETDPTGKELLAIALDGSGASEVLLRTEGDESCPPSATPCGSEGDLLEAFCRRVRELDPDVLTGWNINEFDLPALQRVAQRCGVSLELGREPGGVRWSSGPRGFARQVTVPGRSILDGIPLLRGAFVRMESYTLDFVAREILGEGKLVAGSDRGKEIQRLYREDLERFVAYNLADARLVREILEKLELIELTVERSRLTGMPPHRVSSSIAAFDFLYLSELNTRDVVAPTVGSVTEGDEPTSGGHVFKPLPGLFDNILVFDFKSLYPSIIRTFEIDPLGLFRGRIPPEDAIVAPNGAAFRRERGILTQLLNELVPRREAAQAAGNRVASQAIKILMNSFYGVLGTSACRFHDSRLANAITSFGRELLLWSKGHFESSGHRVLYGDTDSLFVESRQTNPVAARNLGVELLTGLNRALTDHIKATWRVESRLELKLERLYLRLYLPAVRHGTEGARKRYAGLIEEDGEKRVVFTGMEAVRRDWTELARQTQRELYERLFFDRPIKEYLRGIVSDVRSGKMDALLIYRKALRKKPSEYTSTTPPHVAAARKMSQKPGRIIAYVMTTAGPEPQEERKHPFDYEHYLLKQLQPVAEPILALLNLSFLGIIGRDEQLELF